MKNSPSRKSKFQFNNPKASNSNLPQSRKSIKRRNMNFYTNNTPKSSFLKNNKAGTNLIFDTTQETEIITPKNI